MNPGIGSNTEGMRLVLGRVWLPITLGARPAPYPAALARVQDPSAKSGMVVTPGSPITVQIPATLRSVLAMQYSAPAPRVVDGQDVVRFDPCGKGYGDVTVWAGGYVFKHPLCMHLLVRANGEAAKVEIPLGRVCT